MATWVKYLDLNHFFGSDKRKGLASVLQIFTSNLGAKSANLRQSLQNTCIQYLVYKGAKNRLASSIRVIWPRRSNCESSCLPNCKESNSQRNSRKRFRSCSSQVVDQLPEVPRLGRSRITMMIIMIRPFHNRILKIVSEKYVLYTCCSPPRMVLAAKMQEPTRARNHRLVFAIAHSSDFVLVCISYCFGGHLESILNFPSYCLCLPCISPFAATTCCFWLHSEGRTQEPKVRIAHGWSSSSQWGSEESEESLHMVWPIQIWVYSLESRTPLQPRGTY